MRVRQRTAPATDIMRVWHAVCKWGPKKQPVHLCFSLFPSFPISLQSLSTDIQSEFPPTRNYDVYNNSNLASRTPKTLEANPNLNGERGCALTPCLFSTPAQAYAVCWWGRDQWCFRQRHIETRWLALMFLLRRPRQHMTQSIPTFYYDGWSFVGEKACVRESKGFLTNKANDLLKFENWMVFSTIMAPPIWIHMYMNDACPPCRACSDFAACQPCGGPGQRAQHIFRRVF